MGASQHLDVMKALRPAIVKHGGMSVYFMFRRTVAAVSTLFTRWRGQLWCTLLIGRCVDEAYAW